MSDGTSFCPGPVSRRSFMEIGGAACGLGLAELLEAQAKSAPKGQTGKDTSVIFVWLPGGPPHMEMYDMKPEAPKDDPPNGKVDGIPVVGPGGDAPADDQKPAGDKPAGDGGN